MPERTRRKEERRDKIMKMKVDKKIEQCSNELVDEWEEEAAICSSLAGDNKQAKHKSTLRAAFGIKLASDKKKQVKCKSTWRVKHL